MHRGGLSPVSIVPRGSSVRYGEPVALTRRDTVRHRPVLEHKDSGDGLVIAPPIDIRGVVPGLGRGALADIRNLVPKENVLTFYITGGERCPFLDEKGKVLYEKREAFKKSIRDFCDIKIDTIPRGDTREASNRIRDLFDRFNVFQEYCNIFPPSEEKNKLFSLLDNALRVLTGELAKSQDGVLKHYSSLATTIFGRDFSDLKNGFDQRETQRQEALLVLHSFMKRAEGSLSYKFAGELHNALSNRFFGDELPGIDSIDRTRFLGAYIQDLQTAVAMRMRFETGKAALRLTEKKAYLDETKRILEGRLGVLRGNESYLCLAGFLGKGETLTFKDGTESYFGSPSHAFSLRFYKLNTDVGTPVVWVAVNNFGVGEILNVQKVVEHNAGGQFFDKEGPGVFPITLGSTESNRFMGSLVTWLTTPHTGGDFKTSFASVINPLLVPHSELPIDLGFLNDKAYFTKSRSNMSCVPKSIMADLKQSVASFVVHKLDHLSKEEQVICHAFMHRIIKYEVLLYLRDKADNLLDSNLGLVEKYNALPSLINARLAKLKEKILTSPAIALDRNNHGLIPETFNEKVRFLLSQEPAVPRPSAEPVEESNCMSCIVC